MFHVGQEIICVDGRRLKHTGYGEVGPVKGERYTVRALHGKHGLRVHEIKNKAFYYAEGRMECWFDPCRFRAIEKRSTNISCFTALLNPTPQKVRESIGYDLGFTKEQIGTS